MLLFRTADAFRVEFVYVHDADGLSRSTTDMQFQPI